MTQLEKAKGKLNRLQNESYELHQQAREELHRIPFGQPNIIGRRDIYKDINRKFQKSFKLHDEAVAQTQRVEMLEEVEKTKAENELLKDVHVVGKTKYATIGAKTSVNNIEYFEQKLIELEEKNKKAKAYNKTKPDIKARTYGTDITSLKQKISILKDMREKDENQILSEKTKELIESGAVTQWKKKPIYYFVKGLKKVALEIDEQGNFFISKRYYAYSEEDKTFISNLLK